MTLQKRDRGFSQPAGRDAGDGGAAKSSPTINYGPLEKQLGYLLRRAQIAVFQDFFAVFSDFDIRPAQYSVLTVIELNPGLSQTQLCDALGIQKANFVAILDALEARGLVRRDSTPKDRRSYALFLTDTGRDFMRKLHGMAAKHEQRIADRMSIEAHHRIFEMLQALVSTGDEETATSPESQTAMPRNKVVAKTRRTNKSSPRRRAPL
jgi:DNA-binding MarR family transcriptional regulator